MEKKVEAKITNKEKIDGSVKIFFPLKNPKFLPYFQLHSLYEMCADWQIIPPKGSRFTFVSPYGVKYKLYLITSYSFFALMFSSMNIFLAIRGHSIYSQYSSMRYRTLIGCSSCNNQDQMMRLDHVCSTRIQSNSIQLISLDKLCRTSYTTSNHTSSIDT